MTFRPSGSVDILCFQNTSICRFSLSTAITSMSSSRVTVYLKIVSLLLCFANFFHSASVLPQGWRCSCHATGRRYRDRRGKDVLMLRRAGLRIPYLSQLVYIKQAAGCLLCSLGNHTCGGNYLGGKPSYQDHGPGAAHFVGFGFSSVWGETIGDKNLST